MYLPWICEPHFTRRNIAVLHSRHRKDSLITYSNLIKSRGFFLFAWSLRAGGWAERRSGRTVPSRSQRKSPIEYASTPTAAAARTVAAYEAADESELHELAAAAAAAASYSLSYRRTEAIDVANVESTLWMDRVLFLGGLIIIMLSKKKKEEETLYAHVIERHTTPHYGRFWCPTKYYSP